MRRSQSPLLLPWLRHESGAAASLSLENPNLTLQFAGALERHRHSPGAPASYGDWLDRTATLGFLVGVPSPDISGTMKLPLANALFLVAKLLTPAEYEFVAERGPQGARTLIDRFAKDQTYHLSSLHRKSVV